MKSMVNPISRRVAAETWPWLEDCKFEGGRFYEFLGRPIYENGDWVSGVWKFGKMTNCKFHAGKMEKHSTFEKGEWLSGIFEGFMITHSVWHGGIFRSGYFENSKWFSGKFEYGIFKDAMWQDGTVGPLVRVWCRDKLFIGRIPKKMKIKVKKNKKSKKTINKKEGTGLSKFF